MKSFKQEMFGFWRKSLVKQLFKRVSTKGEMLLLNLLWISVLPQNRKRRYWEWFVRLLFVMLDVFQWVLKWLLFVSSYWYTIFSCTKCKVVQWTVYGTVHISKWLSCQYNGSQITSITTLVKINSQAKMYYSSHKCSTRSVCKWMVLKHKLL
jgi:hypothetical protein